MSISLFLAVLATTAPTAVAVATQLDEPNPKVMSSSEIRAFNAKLARTHPYYIRCVKSAATGSLIKRDLSCRTNEQWERSERAGNDEVRDVMEHTRSKSWNTGG